MPRDEDILVLIVGQEYPDHIEIDAGSEVRAVTFTANGEYLVGGVRKEVQVWRVKDGERVATMKVEDGVWSVAVSKDGRFIAAVSDGGLFVWDATTHEQVFADSLVPFFDVDFSPDSTRLVSADSLNNTATI